MTELKPRRIRRRVSLAVLAAALTALGSNGIAPQAGSQTAGSTMDQRVDQIVALLRGSPTPNTALGAVEHALEILYGGMRPVPTKGEAMGPTQQADNAIRAAEQKLATALDDYAKRARDADAQRAAVDAKLFIEQMDEVARAVGVVTRQCGQGDRIDQPPCDQLKPLLDEETGAEGAVAGAPPAGQPPTVIAPSYRVKLRSPFVPPFFTGFQEDVHVTDPIAPGQCAVVFKEVRGLMIKLHFDAVIVVTDPWVATFGVPRGTRIPIWRLEFVPSEFAKTFNLCNLDGRIQQTVAMRVVQDVSLTYFWRFYQKN